VHLPGDELTVLRRTISTTGLADAFSRVAMGLLCAWFAYVHLNAFLDTGRVGLALAVAFESVFAVMFLARKPALESSFSLRDCVATAGGTFLPLLLRPAPLDRDVLAGSILQVTASLICIWAILTLNRRIGLLPANRGICSNGPYRVVRHPLYSAYTLGLVGYLISNLSAVNVAIVVIGSALQMLRAESEERLLNNDPTYRSYASRTTWRVVPFVY
jgi:protein-S-isoprenylcysteine O-methyltransferase Ste14